MDGEPALFLGQVMHHRLRPAENAFVYPVFFVTLPLRRLDEADGGLFRIDRPGLLSFRQADHGARDGSPLLPWIIGKLADAGLPTDGEIVLQTFPRLLGYVFNPVSFWYCHDRDGALVAVLAEVNNTFGGRHAYLLHHPDGRPIADGEELSAPKVFHVSPFNTVCGGYRFRFRHNHGRYSAAIDYDDAEGELLRTCIGGRAAGWGTSRWLAALARMPLMTLGVIFRIHWQALRLWRKGVPFHGATPPLVNPQPEPSSWTTR